MSKNNTLNLKNAPKATGRILDDTEALALNPIGAALNEAIEEQLSTEAIAVLDDLDAPDNAPAETLEQHAEAATSKLKDFRLSPLAKTLLDRAIVNVSENTGRGIEDPVAKAQIEALAGIIKASGDDLTTAIEVIVEAMEGDAATYVYKLCYAIQKALNFQGNIAFRRALDPKSDFDLHAYVSGGQAVGDKGAKFAVDQREEHRTAPAGMGDDNAEIAFDADGNRLFNSAGGELYMTDYEQIIEALSDLHVYLQVLTEAMGWNPEIAMPYLVLRDPITEEYTQINDCEEALDVMELRYKESRAKKQEKQLAGLKKIQALALAALKRAAK